MVETMRYCVAVHLYTGLSSVASIVFSFHKSFQFGCTSVDARKAVRIQRMKCLAIPTGFFFQMRVVCYGR